MSSGDANRKRSEQESRHRPESWPADEGAEGETIPWSASTPQAENAVNVVVGFLNMHSARRQAKWEELFEMLEAEEMSLFAVAETHLRGLEEPSCRLCDQEAETIEQLVLRCPALTPKWELADTQADQASSHDSGRQATPPKASIINLQTDRRPFARSPSLATMTHYTGSSHGLEPSQD
ncbi:hypothetical protein HPB47_025215 [Ixodes persulcatus]|uniref:Uncharacterized protein n=1 Tax=Ixodes persulcatus TaxID=34615 RepID=A0AC60Q237_IXOPE|nr:hypothetical protein HPB47_025215 [Ixodes persulcatus]